MSFAFNNPPQRQKRTLVRFFQLVDEGLQDFVYKLNKLDIVWTNQFKKDYKQAMKRHLDIGLLDDVIRKLAGGQQLPERNKDHALTGNWTGHRECHIQPDWLLVYRIEDDLLILTLSRTGTHSDLFGK